jgi:hypothetical protein
MAFSSNFVAPNLHPTVAPNFAPVYALNAVKTKVVETSQVKPKPLLEKTYMRTNEFL